jgi:hypothetical protein
MANDRGLRGQVLDVLRRSDEPLNDDEIAAIVGANRHYVNTLCRDLAVTGVIVRSRGPAGKLANSMPSAGGSSAGSPKPDAVLPDRPRRRRAASAPNGNLQDLMAGFPSYVATFEERRAFPGPGLYFHERAIERRRTHDSVQGLLRNRCFLEYVYAVLPAWGMHRMGPQAAKVAAFEPIVEALHEHTRELDVFWPLRITSLLNRRLRMSPRRPGRSSAR